MKILLAIEDPQFAEAAMQAVISQFRPDHTHVFVLHAVDWSNFMPSPFPRGGEEAMYGARQLESIIESELSKAIAAGFMVVSNIYTTVAYLLHERIWDRVKWGKTIYKVA